MTDTLSKFSGLKDTDREILKYVDDEELLGVCSIDKRMWNSVCDDAFLKRRLSKYPEIERYKEKGETWKTLFLRVVYYISKMQDKFKFKYESGNFKEQYDMIKIFRVEILLFHASRRGELSLVKYAVSKGANIHVFDEEALRLAAQFGHLNVVKYIIQQGANIHERDDYALIMASHNGYLEIVKYLIENGADIHALDDKALKCAKRYGHEEVVEYLLALN